jgi:Myb-like DNA-binding protein FlbD
MPQHKRGPWSQTEDQFLVHLVNLHGAHNWVRISATIQTRSPKQCRERYHQNLKPNLNHDPITPEEGVLIEQMVGEMGKRWAEIARRLRGRSDNAVKNWWNGGMNRRRRSNAPRAAGEISQQPHMSMPNLSQPPTHHHSMPSSYVQQAPVLHGYYGQNVYQNPMPQQGHLSMSSNGSVYSRHSGLVESPLPSPSAFSHISMDGAPSLMSDSSSISGRSPHTGPSPIELPPLAGSRDSRRHSAHSAGSGLRLSVPGSFTEIDFSQPPMPKPPTPHMLQEAFQPQRQPQSAFPQPAHYLPSQPAEPMPQQPMQMQQMQQFNMAATQQMRGGPYTQAYMQHAPMQQATMQAVQLPSIANLSMSDARRPTSSLPIDPSLTMHTPAVPSAPTPEGSPKDKMSLSNLTH